MVQLIQTRFVNLIVKNNWQKQGFALPTVLIASVVMLTIMAVSVSSVATVRVTLKEQYYEQLAKTAGEAGVAYAKACLAKNTNVPQWSDEKPLRPDTDCSGNILAGGPSRYILENDELRSSFRVGMPTLGSDGTAVTLPQTGYVELLRKTDGQPWRLYTQPSVQAAVVPDLCSGAATAALGWGYAYISDSGTTTLSGPGSSALTIDPGYWPRAGYTYLRKDFYAPTGGNYRIAARLASSNNFSGDFYIDGVRYLDNVTSAQKTSSNISLSAGCHVVTVRILSNLLSAASPLESRVAAAVYKDGASVPLVSTDPTWRRISGPQRKFSEFGYHATPNLWSNVYEGPVHASWTAASSTTGNSTARWITPIAGRDPVSGNSTNARYYYLRSPDSFVVSGSDNVEARISVMCDDSCDVYLDGNHIMSSVGSTTVSTSSITLTPGSHTLGFSLFNTGTVPNPTRITAAVVATGSTILETNGSWVAADSVYASDVTLVSSDRFFVPYPNEIP